jgi:hypothetical protein
VDDRDGTVRRSEAAPGLLRERHPARPAERRGELDGVDGRACSGRASRLPQDAGWRRIVGVDAIRQIFLGSDLAAAGLGVTVLGHSLTVGEEIALVGALGIALVGAAVWAFGREER